MTITNCVIVGAGGHGREIAEILQADPRVGFSIKGFIDDDRHLSNQIINGLPVLGDWSWFETADRRGLAVICALGSAEDRRKTATRAAAQNLSFCSAVSPAASVSSHVRLGEGVMILPHAVVGPNCIIGDHVIINVGATVSHDSQIARFSTINPGVHIAGNVSIGEGCYVGVGASVIHGISVGAWSIVGGGAVVTDDLPANVTAVGVPAKVIKTHNQR